MSLDHVTFPTKPANPVVKFALAAERFTYTHPLTSWLCVLAFAAVVMVASAVTGVGQ